MNEQAKILFNEAYDLYIAKNYYKSISKFKKVIKKQPDCDEAHYFIGCAFECLNLAVLATPHYQADMAISKEKYGENSAEFARALHNLGTNAAWLKDNNTALRLAEEALEIVEQRSVKPDDVFDQVWHEICSVANKRAAVLQAHARLGQYEDAIQIAQILSQGHYLASDASALASALKTIESVSKVYSVNWCDSWFAELIGKAYVVSSLDPDCELTEVGLLHSELIGKLVRRAAKIREDTNPRLM